MFEQTDFESLFDESHCSIKLCVYMQLCVELYTFVIEQFLETNFDFDSLKNRRKYWSKRT